MLDVLREARAFVALQREIVGERRLLDATPTASLDAAVAEPAHVEPVAASPAEPAPPPSVEAPAPEAPKVDGAAPRVEAAPAPDVPSAPDAAPPVPTPASASTSPLPDSTDDDVPDLFGDAPDPSQDLSLSPYERVASLIPEDSPLRDMASLDEVGEWLAKTILVPIDADRIKPVLGTGDPEADLMIVGEAPGADEDRTGEPFVGRAGQLLNKILEAVNFRREEVYITNILKSRPPNNRDPQADEVAAHIPILYKQIELVRPKVILAVGKSAGNGLLKKKSSLASLRGTFQDYYGLPLLVTYHPAALLRNPNWKRPTWEDVKLLRTRYDELRK